LQSASAIHQTIEGAGYAYRECVSRKGIDYAGYDALFDRVRQIAPVTAEDIAMNRLMTPYKLYDKAKEQYEGFLRKRSKELLLRLIRLKDTERIRFLTGAHLIDAAVIDDCLDAAAGQAEVAALLMRYR
ncbi:MAG: leucine-rich repeat domain-containing protein, partial [Lachnospiraceae bacterium]|nr:leucine-rich repeat domain-containing protein [Lachnospiraceae bacterium]